MDVIKMIILLALGHGSTIIFQKLWSWKIQDLKNEALCLLKFGFSSEPTSVVNQIEVRGNRFAPQLHELQRQSKLQKLNWRKQIFCTLIGTEGNASSIPYKGTRPHQSGGSSEEKRFAPNEVYQTIFIKGVNYSSIMKNEKKNDNKASY